MSISLPLPVVVPTMRPTTNTVPAQVRLGSREKDSASWVGRFSHRWPLATGIFEFAVLYAAFRLLTSPALLPHWSLPVMPLGLPDLHASFDALVFAAQAMADQPAAQVLPQAPAPSTLPQMPGLDQVIVNLGGWAAILWGLANKIGGQVDRRVSQIEAQLAKLSPMPREVRLLRRELRRYRQTPAAHPLPGSPAEDDPK